MTKTVLVLGSHPVLASVVAQYAARGFCVARAAHDVGLADVAELFVAADAATALAVEADSDALRLLADLAATLDLDARGGRRLPCQLLLRSRNTLRLAQTVGVGKLVEQRFDVYATTLNEEWARQALCGLTSAGLQLPSLDGTGIGAHTAKTVHLVVFGLSDLAESLATTAALTAHYPNYVSNHELRTRITLIAADAPTGLDSFRQRYRQLFDNSYYRRLDLCSERLGAEFHEPMYKRKRREDFVDVEWELVQAPATHALVRQKLELWAGDADQQLTVAVCHDDDDRNYAEAFALPDAVYDRRVTVLVKSRRAEALQLARQSDRYSAVYPVGMPDAGYDVALPLLHMAKRLHYCFACCYAGKGVPTELPAEAVERAWDALTDATRKYSNLFNVLTLPTKMRSLGHDQSDWTRFYALTRAEAEGMAAVEHNRWSVERLLGGYCPPDSTDRAAIRQNIDELIAAQRQGLDTSAMPDLKDEAKKRGVHYDLCAYSELGCDRTGQDVRLYDVELTACAPLIVNTYNEELRHNGQ